MPGFLYFLEGEPVAPSRATLIAKGLDYAFEEGDGMASCGTTQGPGGPGGVVIANSKSKIGKIGFYPREQKWRRVPGQPGVWVGITGKLPGPAELQRSDILYPAVSWELGDGRKWAVPIALQLSEEDAWDARGTVALPKQMDLDESGRWEMRCTVPEWQALESLADAWWKRMVESDGVVYDEPFDDAVTCLQANYRVSSIECAILGVMVTGCAWSIIHFLINMPARWRKQGEAVGEMQPVDGADGESLETPMQADEDADTDAGEVTDTATE